MQKPLTFFSAINGSVLHTKFLKIDFLFFSIFSAINGSVFAYQIFEN